MADSINIQVVYALPERPDLVAVKLPSGSTLQQALDASGLINKHAIDVGAAKFGVFGKISKVDTVLRDKDRVEIYRPLIADPKEVRKARAAEGKAMKKGGGDLSNSEASA